MSFAEKISNCMKNLSSAEITWKLEGESILEIKTKETKVIMKGKGSGYNLFKTEILDKDLEVGKIVDLMILDDKIYRASDYNDKTTLAVLEKGKNLKKLSTIIEFKEFMYPSINHNPKVHYGELKENQYNRIMKKHLEQVLKTIEVRYFGEMKKQYEENHKKLEVLNGKVFNLKQEGNKIGMIKGVLGVIMSNDKYDIEGFKNNENLDKMIRKEIIEDGIMGDKKRLMKLITILGINLEMFLQLGFETATRIVNKDEIVGSFYLSSTKEVVNQLLEKEYIDEIFESIGDVCLKLQSEKNSMRNQEKNTTNEKIMIK